MREKNLIILCVIFAVLLGALYFKKSVEPQVPTTEEIADIISNPVNAGEATSVTITLGDGVTADEEKPRRIKLVKSGDHWIIPTRFGVYARDNTVTPVIDTIDQLQGELRSDNKSLLSDYGIADDEGVHVEVLAGQAKVAGVVVGTQKAGARINFVRKSGTNAVYVVNENLLSSLGYRGEDEEQYLDDNRWLDKRIAHITSNDVVGITVRDAGTTVLDLKKEQVDDKQQWQSALPYDFGLSASKIRQVVENINNTYAQKVVAPDAEGVFDHVAWEALIVLENGETVRLVAGSKDESGNNIYMKQDGAAYYFLVPGSTLNSRKNQLGNIFANNPLKADEGKVDALEVSLMGPEKTFSAIKKTPEENTEQAEGGEKKEDTWVDIAGETVDTAKVRDIINKIRAVGIEAVQPPSKSVETSMEVQITREGVTTAYSITKDIKTDTGKECHYVSVNGKASQGYCASKSTITALKNALP